MRAINALRMRPGSAAGDPYWSNVVALMGFNGADGSTSFVDESGYARTLTAVGNAQIDTAQFKYGTSSLLLDGTGDGVTAADHTDWTFGTGDFTVEAWVRLAILDDPSWLVTQYSSTTSLRAWALYYESQRLKFIAYEAGDVTRQLTATSMTSFPAGTWKLVTMDRAAGVLRLYVDGVMVGKDAAFTHNIRDTASPLYLGQAGGQVPTYDLNGHLDEVRITKGLARYASDSGFTVPSTAFPRS